MLMQSMVITWYALHGHHPDDVTARRLAEPWYDSKTEPSFEDMIALSIPLSSDDAEGIASSSCTSTASRERLAQRRGRVAVPDRTHGEVLTFSRGFSYRTLSFPLSQLTAVWG
jgi:hypothetical protein